MIKDLCYAVAESSLLSVACEPNLGLKLVVCKEEKNENPLKCDSDTDLQQSKPTGKERRGKDKSRMNKDDAELHKSMTCAYYFRIIELFVNVTLAPAGVGGRIPLLVWTYGEKKVCGCMDLAV